MEEEIFKNVQIDGLEHYQVSNKGRVITNKNEEPKFLKPQTDGLGYLHVRLFPIDQRFGMYPNGRGKKPKLQKIHRLVATHFLEVPTEDEIWTVNHKDGNKKNNVVSNLEWVTHAENIQHSWDIGLRNNSPKKIAEKKWRPVKATYRDGSVEYFKSQTHAAIMLNTYPAAINIKITRRERGIEKRPYGKLGCYLERIHESDLPVGETWKSIVDIEERIAKLRERFWPKEKMREYQRARKNADKKKS